MGDLLVVVERVAGDGLEDEHDEKQAEEKQRQALSRRKRRIGQWWVRPMIVKVTSPATITTT